METSNSDPVVPGSDVHGGYMFVPASNTVVGHVGGIKVVINKDFAATNRRGTKRDNQLDTVLNNITPGQGTMLHVASKLGNADVVRALLISGADPSVLDEDGHSAYHRALSEQVTRVYHDVLLQAVAQSNVTLAKKLLQAGIDVNIRDDEVTDNTALHWAASYGNLEMVKLLCDSEANVSVSNVDGATPLHDAVCRGDLGIIGELVGRGANKKTVAKKGKFANKSPLSMAADKPKVKKILEGLPITNGKSNSKGNVTPPITPAKPDKELQEQLANMTSHDVPTGQLRPATHQQFELLWPKPQSILQKSNQEPLKLKPNFIVRVSAATSADYLQQMVDIWSIHGPFLNELGYKCILECAIRKEYPDPVIVCQYVPHLFQGKDHYRISVTDKQMTIQCADFCGLWNASCTAVHLIRLFAEDGIPAVQISDFSDLMYRGVVLDISCGRVPKLDYLMHIVSILTLMKCNELHLYMKAVEGEEVEGVLPYSESELLDLEIYCKWRYMEVIPHLDLDPATELSLDQMGVFKQVLSAFGSSSVVAIGETLCQKIVEGGPPDADSPLARLGAQDKLSLMGVKDSQHVRFCSSKTEYSPGEVSQFPCGSLIMQHGTETNYDFKQPCSALSENGMPFIVCPGTESWNSIAGCPEATIANVHNAVTTAALCPGAIGLLVFDWSGTMHTNQPTASLLGFVTASGLAWNKNVDMDSFSSKVGQLMNVHCCFQESCSVGQAIMELGRVETLLTRSAMNVPADKLPDLSDGGGSFFCQFIVSPDEVNLAHITPEVIQKTLKHIRKVQITLDTAKKTPTQEFAIVELQLTTDIMLWASRVLRILVQAGKKPSSTSVGAPIVNVGLANANITAKTDCANKLLSIMDMYRKVWLHTNHTSGLLECLQIFKDILEKLIPKDDPENGDGDN